MGQSPPRVAVVSVDLPKHISIFILFTIITCANCDDNIPHNDTNLANAEENSGYYEGDILTKMDTRNGLADPLARWPSKVMPYVIGPGYTLTQMASILRAVDILNRVSCVYIRPKKSRDRHYINIMDRNKGCSSYIGFQNQGEQEMNLAPECFEKVGTIIHEFLHCLGFVHQHSSPERDQYITVIWENINPTFHENFMKYPSREVTDFGIIYDPFSIMHYSAYAFGINQQKTIDLKSSNAIADVIGESTMGQRDQLTEKDIIKLNIMYEC